MTKPALAALGLIGLSLAILLTRFYDRPETDPVSVAAEHEQTKSAATYPNTPSVPAEHDGAEESSTTTPIAAPKPTGGSSTPAAPVSRAESSAVTPISPAKPTEHSPAPAASGRRNVRATRDEGPASGFPDDGQLGELEIAGLVQDEDGYPLADIEVLAEPIYLSDTDKMADLTLEARRSARTDSNGSFLFGDLADAEYRIRSAPLEGFAPAETRARVGMMSANLVLMRLRTARVFGIVNSSEGPPLEDVHIIAGPPTRSTKTGSQGHYELDIDIKGKIPHQTIHFRRDGYRNQSISLSPADLDGWRDDIQLDVSMEPLEGLTTVTGRLEGPDGRAVAGKILSLRSSSLQSSYSAQSDLRGDFSLEGVEPGKDYKLSVRPGSDYRDFEREQLEIPDSGLNLKVVLEPLGQGQLSGWMIDVDGNPVPRFALTLHSKVATGQSVNVVGDNRGFFTVQGFPEGSAVLKTNSYPVFETQGIRVSSESEEPLSVVLDMGPYALSGRVTSGSGDTVAAAEVSLGWQYSGNGVQNYSVRKTTADQNGSFAFTGLGSGVHTLRVNAPGVGLTEITIDVGLDPDHIVVELDD